MYIVAATSLLACTGFADRKEVKTDPMAPMPVTVASPGYLVETSFTALILQPYANNLDYAAEALPFNYGNAQPAVSPSWVIPTISPDYQFGFDLGVSWIFHRAKSNLAAHWEWYHSSNESDTKNVGGSNNMVGPFFEIGPDASTYKVAKGTTHFHLDEVRLDYGTYVCFGSLFQANLFSGVSFARIKQHHFTRFQNFADTVVRTIDVPAQFMGAGPEVGLDFVYQVIKGFEFVGNAKAALFVGTFKNSTTFSTLSNDLVLLGDANPNVQTTTVENKGGIVPAFQAKLGFAYEFCFWCCSMARLEAGYQAQIYLNAIRSIDMGSEVALAAVGSVGSATTGVYARTFDRTVSDFALAGPYIEIDVGF